ncbi:MAG: alanine racemase [Candidatus Marinimicrobia bacterium]|nr:alanine racemase [Candidatus Neomarinimicrobiota bacterium]MBT3796698.1 alanine racemase [Candidatus Neomarinimicrobiota bacterium]
MRGPEAIINLSHLKTNYDTVKNHLNGKRIMAVVKANGYGHGSIPCSIALENHGCDFFGVFSIEEGIELRNAGLKSDILVFSALDPTTINDAVKNNLILNISDKSHLDALIIFYKRKSKVPRIHIKVDTGMTRLGLEIDEFKEVLQLLIENPEIKCEGIYSHFATADEGDLSYAFEQEKKFKFILNLADQLDYQVNDIHFSNSGAALNIDQSYCNIIRVGMLLYGALPSNEIQTSLFVQPVMNFVAPIVSIRSVAKNTYVSYGGVYKTNSKTNIAVIQCGFADGLPRSWFKNGYIYYNGKQYRIAGRICMDQFMVDFGDDIPKIDDKVLMIGKDGNNEIRFETIANSIQTTPYVLSTAIGGRTQRIYHG